MTGYPRWAAHELSIPRPLVAILLAACLLVLLLPSPAALAACGSDTDYFGSGGSWKFSTTSTASSGTCDDVNFRQYTDGDGDNNETQSHRGYWYSTTTFDWVPGALGFKTHQEGTLYIDPMLTNMATGGLYKYYSQQNGGWITSLD